MIDTKIFQLIKQRHGHYGSWAIWEKAGKTPKSNIENIKVLDPVFNADLLNQLKPNIVMVGLNISRKLERPFANFHDPRRGSTDFKIRYAFEDTPYCGAYMTDVIKGFEDKISGNVISYLKKNPYVLQKNIEMFKEEIMDLNTNKPIILAFGDDAHKILSDKQNLSPSEYEALIKLPHYSKYIGKENYKKNVWDICGFSSI